MKRPHSAVWLHLQRTMLKEPAIERWHASRHEDSVNVGIPDVSFGLNGINGWIEIKSIDSWPRKARKIKDLTPHQVRWITERGAAGGNCWILLSVGEDYAWIPWMLARRLYIEGVPDRKNAEELWEIHPGGLDPEKTVKLLTKGA